MGAASSKAAKKYPKMAEKPSWAGARTPRTAETIPRPRASEVKNQDIERDAQDPHFLSNLNKLGPVRVDHHMQSFQPAASKSSMLRSRARAEMEETSSAGRNVYAATLSSMLNQQKSCTTRLDIETLARNYKIDIQKLKSISKFVNSPSVDSSSLVKTVDKDGNESRSMLAVWIKPNLRE
ncbi:uncharacterized protein BT62DRAFT_1070429 [Guyanagaster necrorhizus]|uniref:Uncharacterized protein n=1 Tax=Guyanagaster necrorhizus TaxID=856835 RepID=A0A9P8AYA3_9AGAR|nr:uncharacterized protein BT62DRAFT_1070429 [Guyanagaster necrorhizus MCA 3950]KAG7452689.1 hypothetical protein BT62DRAFT_1070429 [Guyanagaster necrorhizus MCA 3950]